MRISPYFTDPPKDAQLRFRYFFLVFEFALLTMAVVWRLNLPADYKGQPNSLLVVAIMLVLGTLASNFRWSTRTTVVLRLVAFGWMVVTGTYLVYLIHSW